MQCEVVAIRGGIGWLAGGDIPNPLSRVPPFVLRACVYYFCCIVWIPCASLHLTCPFWHLLFCHDFFTFVLLILSCPCFYAFVGALQMSLLYYIPVQQTTYYWVSLTLGWFTPKQRGWEDARRGSATPRCNQQPQPPQEDPTPHRDRLWYEGPEPRDGRRGAGLRRAEKRRRSARNSRRVIINVMWETKTSVEGKQNVDRKVLVLQYRCRPR